MDGRERSREREREGGREEGGRWWRGRRADGTEVPPDTQAVPEPSRASAAVGHSAALQREGNSRTHGGGERMLGGGREAL